MSILSNQWGLRAEEAGQGAVTWMTESDAVREGAGEGVEEAGENHLDQNRVK